MPIHGKCLLIEEKQKNMQVDDVFFFFANFVIVYIKMIINFKNFIRYSLFLEKHIVQTPSQLWKSILFTILVIQIRSAAGLPLRDCYVFAEDRHLWRYIKEVTSCQS